MHRHSGKRNHTDDGHEHLFLNDTDITSIDSESENIEPVSSDANLITRTLFSSNANDNANVATTAAARKNKNSVAAQSRVLFPADEAAQVIVKVDATNVATSTSIETSIETSNAASMSHDKGLDISQESSETFIMEANNDDTSIDESVVSYGSGSGSGSVSADANCNTQTPCKFKLNLAFGACINKRTGHSYHSQVSSRKRTSSDRTAPATARTTNPQGLFKAGGSPKSRTSYNDNDNMNMNNSSEAAHFHFDSPVQDKETSARGSPDNFSMKFSDEWLAGSTSTSAYKAKASMKEQHELGSILSTCQVTRSPIDECMPKFHGDHGSNYYTDLDTSMMEEEDDDDSYAVTKFRRLNLCDDAKDFGSFRSNGQQQQQQQPIRMPMGVVPRTVKKAHFPNESAVNPFQLFTSPKENAGQVALGHETTGVGEGSFISPNDVMEQIGILQNPTQNNPSHPTIDFESDMFSPPAPMKKKLTERKSPNGSPFAAPSNASHNHYQNNSIGEMNAPMASFYSNYNLRTSISTTAQPKTPMLERKAPRSRMNFSPPSPEAPKEISRFEQDFDIIGTLGSGYFGTVYKCLSRLDGCTYAIKAAKHRAKGDSERTRMLQEVKALAELSDISDMAAFHIVRYHQAWIEDDRLHIVTDLCHSTLQVEMSKGYLRHEARQYKLLREMLLALKLIHQHGKVHLDIKPENIFLKDDKFKLGDFGLVVEESTVGEVQEGDSRYMCKDLLSGNHRDLTKVSYGIICYCAYPPKNQIKRITLLMTNISFL